MFPPDRSAALSSGALLSCTPQNDGRKVSHWHLESPCAIYLLCIAVGEFTRFEDGEFEGAPIAAFAPKPCTEETLKRCFGPTKAIMDMITKRLGPMPWPKYYQFIALASVAPWRISRWSAGRFLQIRQNRPQRLWSAPRSDQPP